MQELGTSKEKRHLAPPYVSYKTLVNILDRLKTIGIPNRIDRSVMPNLSGGTQMQVLTALRFFTLITEHGNPKPRLDVLIQSEGEERVKALKEVVVQSYPFLFEENFIASATIDQIAEKFKDAGVTGDTQRKSIAFFINIAEDAKIEISPYLKKTHRRERRNSEKKHLNITEKLKSRFKASDKGNKITSPPPLPSQHDSIENWAQMLLRKFPDFDPNWDNELKKKWFEDFDKLMGMGEKKI